MEHIRRLQHLALDQDNNIVDIKNTEDNKKYYSNIGSSITFNRKAGTETQYPILNDNYLSGVMSTLLFAPTGNGEFKVIGSATIGSTTTKAYTCNVVRTNENGTVETYVEVGGATGIYRFEITVQLDDTGVAFMMDRSQETVFPW